MRRDETDMSTVCPERSGVYRVCSSLEMVDETREDWAAGNSRSQSIKLQEDTIQKRPGGSGQLYDAAAPWCGHHYQPRLFG